MTSMMDAAERAVRDALTPFRKPHEDPEFYKAKETARRYLRNVLPDGMPFVVMLHGPGNTIIQVGSDCRRI